MSNLYYTSTMTLDSLDWKKAPDHEKCLYIIHDMFYGMSQTVRAINLSLAHTTYHFARLSLKS